MHMCNFLLNEGTSWYDTLGNDPWSCEPVGFRCGEMIFSIGWVMVRVQERSLLGHPSRLCQFLLSGLTSVSGWWLWWLWIHSDLPGLTTVSAWWLWVLSDLVSLLFLNCSQLSLATENSDLSELSKMFKCHWQLWLIARVPPKSTFWNFNSISHPQYDDIVDGVYER